MAVAIRQLPQAAPPSGLGAANVRIEPEPPEGDRPVQDAKGNVIRIEHGDGSITIDLSGQPLTRNNSEADKTNWWRNLAEDIDAGELSRISEDLLRGVRDDMESRREWVETRADGMRLLGLKVELPGLGGSADGAPVEGISRVRHPLLLEAVLRFQANARSEMLPTDGPVKIRNDDNGSEVEADRLADALENDFNHYLTSTASEYYPDTDRMLMFLGFGGSAFKKIYFCPLRNRPVSETVDADDLIVNNSATDLGNARRITHRTTMKPSTVKRLQILGVYRDIPLSQPLNVTLDSVQREKKAQAGSAVSESNPDDRDREIYEIDCELNIKGYEHLWKGKETGLEIPYRATIDVSTKEILALVRNYDEDTEELPEARETYVQYTFVPGFGAFYGIGLLNILGNTTNAITAAWRELLDAGMYSNFPGFLWADTGGRQNTNIFRVPPGGGAPIKTGGMPINQAVMPLPYKEPSQALMGLVGDISQTGMRIGGTSEQAVGEGRADAPVGTTLALIEQATKVMNSVHKRLHAAQAREFQLLADVFRDHPKSFWQRNKRPAHPWDEQTFLTALDQCNLVPQADPNTSSHTQRIMKIMALKQLQAAQPSLYDPIAIDRAAIQALGFSNPDQFMAPPAAQASPPPELLQAQAQMRQGDTLAAAATTTANARMLDAQTKAKEVGLGAADTSSKGPSEPELRLKAAQLTMENHNRHQDRAADIEIAKMKLQGDAIKAQAEQQHEQTMQQADIVSDHVKHLDDLQSQDQQHAIGLVSDHAQQANDQSIAELQAKAPKPPRTPRKPAGGKKP